MNFKTLINNIENLTNKEKRHILSIFQKYNIDEYTTKNNNGYFINLTKVPIFILNKIETCVILIEKHRELIKNLDNQRDVYLDYYKSLIENKLNETIENKKLEYTKKLLVDEDDTIFIITKKKSKYRNKLENNVDPDILIKEYIKSKKPKKDSVYYNILQKCNRRKTKFKDSDQTDNANANTEDNLNVYDDNDDGNDYDDGDGGNADDEVYVDEIGDEVDEVDEHEHENDELDDITNDEEKNTEHDHDDNKTDINDNNDDDEYYNSDHESENDNENKDRITETVASQMSKNTISISKLTFYKNLLQQKHGFTFNEDRYVKMKREKYLI